MREVLTALRLEQVVVVRVGGVEQSPEGVDFRQMGDRRRRVRIGEPDAVAQTKTGMAVQRDGELARQQFLLDHLAQRGTLRFHRAARRAAIPGQARAETLAADEKRGVLDGVHGGVAHQVHAGRVAARRRSHAARVDQGHEHQAHRIELLVQQAVPAHSRQQAV